MQRSAFEHLLGQVLDDDLMDDYGALVFRADTLITRSALDKLTKHPISHQPRTKTIDYSAYIAGAVQQLSSVFEVAKQENRILLTTVEEQIVPAILVIADDPHVNRLLRNLQTKDHYTVSHSIAVSVIAAMIGKWLSFSPSELSELVTAAALHDVGKAKIPDEILNKPGKLTDAEYRIMQRHTVYGHELIEKTAGTSTALALAALQHHERLDGSGYPYGIANEQITLIAKVIGIADVFHAMSSKRVYHDSLPMYQILSEMRAGMFGTFDPLVLRVFFTRMMESLIGSQVLLSDGRTATIVLINPIDPTLPLVQTADGFVDLTTTSSIRILSLT